MKRGMVGQIRPIEDTRFEDAPAGRNPTSRRQDAASPVKLSPSGHRDPFGWGGLDGRSPSHSVRFRSTRSVPCLRVRIKPDAQGANPYEPSG